MEYELVWIVRLQQSRNRLADFKNKFVCVVVIKSVLEDYLTIGRTITIKCHEKHIVFRVEIYFKGQLLFFNKHLKKLE